MSIKTNEITWGEKVEIRATAKTEAGTDITLDSRWSAACRITKSKIGGEVVENPTMTIADGIATGSVDTGADAWEPGLYFYDVRFTDSEGDDHWSPPYRLIVKDRNAPAS